MPLANHTPSRNANILSYFSHSDVTTTPRVESANNATIKKRKALQELPLSQANAIRREQRTYSKRVKINAAQPCAKRQRIRDVVEERTEIIKRPLRRRLTTKALQTSVPTMSFESSSNEASRSTPAPVSGSSGRTHSSTTQMVFDSLLGVTASVECDECKMHYNCTSKSDVALHDKHHKEYFNEQQYKSEYGTIWKHPQNTDERIICAEPYSNRALKDFAMKTLAQTREDLGGLLYSEREIFMLIPSPGDPNSKKKVPRYKVYIYLKKNIAVSLLLAESIFEAGQYYEGETTHFLEGPRSCKVKPEPGGKYQAYANKDKAQEALMMVDRIWTKGGHRRQGHATKLIDEARDKDFIPGYPMPRTEVAFSWPTSEGKELAAEYQADCFEDTPFLVGLDVAPYVVEDDKLWETSHCPKWA